MKVMKYILTIILFALSLMGDSIKIKNGWQLLGATQDIDITIFDNSCIDLVWKYNNNKWAVYIANGQTYPILDNIARITLLNKGEGYWIKGNNNCTINTSIIQNGNTLIWDIDNWDDSNWQ